MNAPTVLPIKIKDYTVRQSNYDVVGKLPIRSIILGPSGSGQTVRLQNMILDIYIKAAVKGSTSSVFQLMRILHGCQ